MSDDQPMGQECDQDALIEWSDSEYRRRWVLGVDPSADWLVGDMPYSVAMPSIEKGDRVGYEIGGNVFTGIATHVDYDKDTGTSSIEIDGGWRDTWTDTSSLFDGLMEMVDLLIDPPATEQHRFRSFWSAYWEWNESVFNEVSTHITGILMWAVLLFSAYMLLR